MWIRINDFIINLDNVTNINIERGYVHISFCQGSSYEMVEYNDGAKELYRNCLAFKEDDVPDSVWKNINALPKHSWDFT